jgi:uncharacterized protein (TIGR02452 family)
MAPFQSNEATEARKRLQISRDKAKALGHETVAILQAGYYVHASGTQVDIEEQMDEAVCGTISYPPEKELPQHSQQRGSMTIEVRNETTLSAAEYLRSKGFDPAALNFAKIELPGTRTPLKPL